jgi:SAM-dependent methyltransferase
MAQENNYPDFVARFYDVIYEQVITGVDRKYYVRKIVETDGPVLELGTGTGRIFIEALNRGADIHGIDVSDAMIRKLRGKIAPEHRRRLQVQDAVRLHLEKKFDLIVAPFRVFSHIIEVDDQLQALNRVYDHLNPGGRLIFDLYVPNLQMLLSGIHDNVDFEGEYEPGKKLKRITSMRADLISQISYVSMTFVWQEGGKEISKEWRFPMRYYFRFELEHLIHRSPLTLENIYGDFHEGKLNAGSSEFVVVCRRAG